MFQICLESLVLGIHRTALIFIVSRHWFLLNIALAKTVGHTLCRLIDFLINPKLKNFSSIVMVVTWAAVVSSSPIVLRPCRSQRRFEATIAKHQSLLIKRADIINCDEQADLFMNSLISSCDDTSLLVVMLLLFMLLELKLNFLL